MYTKYWLTQTNYSNYVLMNQIIYWKYQNCLPIPNRQVFTIYYDSIIILPFLPKRTRYAVANHLLTDQWESVSIQVKSTGILGFFYRINTKKWSKIPSPICSELIKIWYLFIFLVFLKYNLVSKNVFGMLIDCWLFVSVAIFDYKNKAWLAVWATLLRESCCVLLKLQISCASFVSEVTMLRDHLLELALDA